MTFRPDIQGLRALAVVAVILFHFDLPGFRGGFIGVDIFFVLSGYLMTAIPLAALSNDTFSLIRFYADRARRILPALVAFLLVMLAFGHLILLPVDFATLGRQALAALAFVSNIHFWNTSGYFDTAARETWLLHTWSLSVEWQFYVLYPLLLAGLWKRFGEAGVRWGVGALALLSLALSILLTPVHPGAAFYLLPTRIWEFLAGGLTLLWEKDAPPWRHRLLWPGLLSILLACLFFDPEQDFPGSAALLPVLGTVAALLGGSPTQPLLTHPVMRHLGDISYSLYLWHWPVAVAVGFLAETIAPGAKLILPLLVWLLALASCFGVERPFRRAPESSQVTFALLFLSVPLWLAWHLLEPGPEIKGVAAMFGGVLLGLAIASRWLRRAPGENPRLFGAILLTAAVALLAALVQHGLIPARRLDGVAKEETQRAHYRIGNCHLAYDRPANLLNTPCLDDVVKDAPPRSVVMIWGDCHGAHLDYGLQGILPAMGLRVAQVTHGSCMPLLPPQDEGFTPLCRDFNQFALERVAQNAQRIALVLLSPAWPLYRYEPERVVTGMTRTLAALRQLGVEGSVVGPLPTWSRSLPDLLNLRAMTEGEIPRRMAPEPEAYAYSRALDQQLRTAFGARYLSMLDPLCNADGCLTLLPGSWNQPVQLNQSMFSAQGSDWVARTILLPHLRQRLQPSP